MEPMGYILLAVIGLFAFKAFGSKGGGIPSFPGGASPIDPATGAKIINTTGLMSNLTSIPGASYGPNQPGQTSGAAARIAATDIGGGKFWCPYPFTLYKDQADGKFYCYNEAAPIGTTSAPDTGKLVDTSGNSPLLPGSLIPGSGGATTDWETAATLIDTTQPASPPVPQYTPADYAAMSNPADYVQTPSGPNDQPTLPSTAGVFIF